MEIICTLCAASRDKPLSLLYRAPVLGGTPEKLVTDVDTNITFSPDGRSLAYAVNEQSRTRQVPASDLFAGNQ